MLQRLKKWTAMILALTMLMTMAPVNVMAGTIYTEPTFYGVMNLAAPRTTSISVTLHNAKQGGSNSTPGEVTIGNEWTSVVTSAAALMENGDTVVGAYTGYSFSNVTTDVWLRWDPDCTDPSHTWAGKCLHYISADEKPDESETGTFLGNTPVRVNYQPAFRKQETEMNAVFYVLDNADKNDTRSVTVANVWQSLSELAAAALEEGETLQGAFIGNSYLDSAVGEDVWVRWDSDCADPGHTWAGKCISWIKSAEKPSEDQAGTFKNGDALCLIYKPVYDTVYSTSDIYLVNAGTGFTKKVDGLTWSLTEEHASAADFFAANLTEYGSYVSVKIDDREFTDGMLYADAEGLHALSASNKYNNQTKPVDSAIYMVCKPAMEDVPGDELTTRVTLRSVEEYSGDQKIIGYLTIGSEWINLASYYADHFASIGPLQGVNYAKGNYKTNLWVHMPQERPVAFWETTTISPEWTASDPSSATAQTLNSDTLYFLYRQNYVLTMEGPDTIPEGQQANVQLHVSPMVDTNGAYRIEYTTDNADVLTIDGKGNMTAAAHVDGAPVDVKITATLYVGEHEVSVEKTVTVTPLVEGTPVTLRFDANGGSGTVPDTVTGFAGDLITLPDAGDMTKPYCTFRGWSLYPEANRIYDDGEIHSDIYPAGSKYELTEVNGVKLYAVWAQNEGTNYGFISIAIINSSVIPGEPSVNH